MTKLELAQKMEEMAEEYRNKSDNMVIGNPDRTFNLGVALGFLKAQGILLTEVIEEGK